MRTSDGFLLLTLFQLCEFFNGLCIFPMYFSGHCCDIAFCHVNSYYHLPIKK